MTDGKDIEESVVVVPEELRKESISSVSSVEDMNKEEFNQDDALLHKTNDYEPSEREEAVDNSCDEEEDCKAAPEALISAAAGLMPDDMKLDREEYDADYQAITNETEKIVDSSLKEEMEGKEEEGEIEGTEVEYEKEEGSIETIETMVHDGESAEEMQPVQSMLNPSSIQQLEISEAQEDQVSVLVDSYTPADRLANYLAENPLVEMEKSADYNAESQDQDLVDIESEATDNSMIVVEPVIDSVDATVLCESEPVAEKTAYTIIDDKSEASESDSDAEDHEEEEREVIEIAESSPEESFEESKLELVGQVDVTDNIEANKVVDDSSSSDSEDSVVEHKELIETQREIIEEPVAEFESNIKSESESYIAYETVDETQVMDEGNTECFDQQEDVVQPLEVEAPVEQMSLDSDLLNSSIESQNGDILVTKEFEGAEMHKENDELVSFNENFASREMGEDESLGSAAHQVCEENTQHIFSSSQAPALPIQNQTDLMIAGV